MHPNAILSLLLLVLIFNTRKSLLMLCNVLNVKHLIASYNIYKINYDASYYLLRFKFRHPQYSLFPFQVIKTHSFIK